MLNVFKDVSDLDKRCYEKFGLSEDILMEHASNAINLYIRNKFSKGSTILIVSGPGNNGADGIALARQLYGDFTVNLYLPFGAKSKMAKLQLERIVKLDVPLVDEISDADIIVDALFGTGLNKSLDSFVMDLLKQLNSFNGYKIACDIPSGIKKSGMQYSIAFKADMTMTMGALKLACFSDIAKDYVGDLRIANLGLSRILYEIDTNYHLLKERDMKLPIRTEQDTNKGDFGHLTIMSGNKEGAAIIAGKSAMNFGVGLVSLVSKAKIDNPYELMQSRVLPEKKSALALGMGLGDDYSPDELVDTVSQYKKAVLDADMFYKQEIVEIIKSNNNIVLTPHPREFASLLSIAKIIDVSIDEIQIDRFKYALKFIDKFQETVLVLKGSNVIIGYKNQLYINPYGTNALSKAGSGDVLSGLIGSLLAQGYSPLDAAITGTLALTSAATKIKKNNYALTPTDLIEQVARLK